MAAAATTTVLVDGPRNLIVLVNIAGTTGDLAGATLIDRSTFVPTDGTELVVVGVEGNLDGFSASLAFDATADLTFAALPANTGFGYDWSEFGGVSSNKAGAGANGDILITTTGFTGAPDAGTFILRMKKV
jgi:hypothetical protein